jgi:hypothetical protein
MVSEWRKRLKPASYKEVPFFVDSHEKEFGRVWIRHDYSGRDLPFHENRQLSPDAFTIQAYIVTFGEDYFPLRDRLEAALKEPSPGILVHPYLGKKWVVPVHPVRMRETKRTFELTGDPPFAEPKPDWDAQVLEGKKSIFAKAKEYLQNVDLDGPDFLKDTFLGDIVTWANDFGDLVRTIPEIVGEALREVDIAIGGMIYDVVGVGDWIQGKIEGLSNLATTSRTYNAFNAAMALMGWGDEESWYSTSLETIPTGTTFRDQQQENRDALFDLIRWSATGEAALAAIAVDYQSRNEAEKVRDLFDEAISREITRAGDRLDDEGWQELYNLRMRVSRALDQKAGTLPEIVTYTVPQTVKSALVLAYEKYEDLDREQEILDRNRFVNHPAFLPGGVDLELLNA